MTQLHLQVTNIKRLLILNSIHSKNMDRIRIGCFKHKATPGIKTTSPAGEKSLQ
jgi:hypothetical protein